MKKRNVVALFGVAAVIGVAVTIVILAVAENRKKAVMPDHDPVQPVASVTKKAPENEIADDVAGAHGFLGLDCTTLDNTVCHRLKLKLAESTMSQIIICKDLPAAGGREITVCEDGSQPALLLDAASQGPPPLGDGGWLGLLATVWGPHGYLFNLSCDSDSAGPVVESCIATGVENVFYTAEKKFLADHHATKRKPR